MFSRKVIRSFFTMGSIDEHAAALSFYIMLALVPLLFLTLWLGSLAFDFVPIERVILSALSDSLSPTSVSYVEGLFHNAADFSLHLGWSFLGLIIVVVTLVRALREVDVIFADLFSGRQRQRQGWFRVIVWYVAGLLLLAIFILLACVAVLTVAGFSFIIELFFGTDSTVLPEIIGTALSLSVATLFFGLLYRVLSYSSISWLAAAKGGLMAAILFQLLNVLFATVLQSSATFAFYGVASSFVGFMLWVYYVVTSVLVGAVVAANSKS